MPLPAMRATAGSGGSLIRAGTQRAYSLRSGAQRRVGREAPSSARRSGHHNSALLAATAVTGATLCVATVAAVADDHNEEGRSGIAMSTLRPLQEVSREALLDSLRLLNLVPTTVYADAGAAGTEAAESLSSGMSAELAEGEKPEFIKQADEAAEKKQSKKLRRPKQFADQFHEVRGLTSVHSFEGFRLDLAKVVTPTFYNSHTIFFPNSQMPNGLYQGVLTVLGDNDRFIRASMDHDFNLGSEVHLPLGGGVQGKLNLQMGKQEVVVGTASYVGETFSSQVTAGVGPVFGVSYNQALTPRLHVGGDGNFSIAQNAAQLQYGFKYHGPEWAFTGSLISGGGGNMVIAQYVRRVVPGRVSLAAEYQAQMLNPEASQACVGAEFTLRQSKVSASVDSSGKVDSTMEMKLLTFLPTLPVTFTLSSSLDHAEDKATFGVGLSLGQ